MTCTQPFLTLFLSRFVPLFLQLVIEEDKKFLKLLELLGHYQEKGSVIIFVDKQEHADGLLKDLMKASYPCMSLHGGKGAVILLFLTILNEHFPTIIQNFKYVTENSTRSTKKYDESIQDARFVLQQQLNQS